MIVEQCVNTKHQRGAEIWDFHKRGWIVRHYGCLARFSSCIICSHCLSRFVTCNERLPELVESAAFNLITRLAHQVQIEMQIVHGNQAKPENFFRLNKVANVAAREFAAG